MGTQLAENQPFRLGTWSGRLLSQGDPAFSGPLCAPRLQEDSGGRVLGGVESTDFCLEFQGR